MLTTRRCVSAIAILCFCAAARSLAAQVTVPDRCKCSTPPGPPPVTGPITGPGDEGHRHRSRRIPPLAPLGLVAFLMGASSDIPGAAQASATAPSAPVGDTLRMTEVADSTRPSDAQTGSAFRAKVDSLAQGLRAPDTASWLPTLVAGGVVLMGAGAALLRRPRA